MIGRNGGRAGEAIADVKASRNFVDEQAQKSKALSFGMEQRSLVITLMSNSSSMCSCARNSRRLGVRSKH